MMIQNKITLLITWTLTDTLDASTVIEAINKAKACRNTDRSLIIHSDRGSQYVSNAWCVTSHRKEAKKLFSQWLSLRQRLN